MEKFQLGRKRLATLVRCIRIYGNIRRKIPPIRGHVNVCRYHDQTILSPGRECIIKKENGEGIISVSINTEKLKEYWGRLGWKPPFPHVSFGPAPNHGDVIYSGFYIGKGNSIFLSPVNIRYYQKIGRDEIADFRRNICWVLAHEMKHHEQRVRKSWAYDLYYNEANLISLKTVSSYLLAFLAALNIILIIFYKLSLDKHLIISFICSAVLVWQWICFDYILPLTATIICEYQAYKFAYKQIKNNWDYLGQCISVRSDKQMPLNLGKKSLNL